jgi:hypothetical protein
VTSCPTVCTDHGRRLLMSPCCNIKRPPSPPFARRDAKPRDVQDVSQCCIFQFGARAARSTFAVCRRRRLSEAGRSGQTSRPGAVDALGATRADLAGRAVQLSRFDVRHRMARFGSSERFQQQNNSRLTTSVASVTYRSRKRQIVLRSRPRDGVSEHMLLNRTAFRSKKAELLPR